MNRTRAIKTLVAAAVLASLAGYGISGVAAGREGAPSATAYPPQGSVPDDVVSDLKGFGVEFGDSRTPSSGATVTTLEEAADLAKAEFGLAKDQTVRSASLATVTTNGYGAEQQADPNKPSNIAPAIDHQLVWVITFDSVPMPVFGTGTEAEKETTMSLSSLTVFIDPTKSEFLYALSY